MRRRGVLVSVVLAGLLAACGIGGPDGEPLLGARLLPDDANAVEVEFGGCDSDRSARVVELETSVRVTVDGPDGGCEPVHELTIELVEPLGDRTLVDGATGDVVEVTPAE